MKKILIMSLIILTSIGVGIFKNPIVSALNSIISGYKISQGETLTISKDSQCNDISNTSANQYFIPTKTTVELSAFINNTPSWITIQECIICSSSQHLVGNTCIANTQTCSIPNGSGQQTWNISSSAWNGCGVSTCNSGHVVSWNSCIPQSWTWQYMHCTSSNNAKYDASVSIGWCPWEIQCDTVGTVCFWTHGEDNCWGTDLFECK